MSYNLAACLGDRLMINGRSMSDLTRTIKDRQGYTLTELTRYWVMVRRFARI
jgi:hypothetical protein